MAAASAAQTALCGQFGFAETSLLIVEFCNIYQSPILEKASGDFDLRQSTMAAASAAQTALCGRFGFSETGSLASVGA